MANQRTTGAIAVGVDGSVWSRSALTWAIDQAAVEHRPLLLVHAGAAPDRAVLDRACAEAMRRFPALEVHRLLSSSSPHDLLSELSAEAAMVVLGSRGRGPVRSLFLGSVGVAVTRHASCPVVVVRPGNPGIVRNGVLVGVDGERSQRALDFAFRQASLHAMPLTVLHTFVDSMVFGPTPGAPVMVPAMAPLMLDARQQDLENERLVLSECLSGMQETYPDVRVSAELARGFPQELLLQRAARMNLIVVGSHVGRSAAGLAFGSVSASMVEHATCPVAVVPVGRG